MYLKNNRPIHHTGPIKANFNTNAIDFNNSTSDVRVRSTAGGGMLSNATNRTVTKRQSDQIIQKNAIKLNGSPVRNKGFQWLLPFG